MNCEKKEPLGNSGETHSDLVALIKVADAQDRGFIVQMSRHANVIEDRPLPSPDSDEVLEQMPTEHDLALLALDAAGKPLGAIWTYRHTPPLLTDQHDIPIPEIVIAVIDGARGNNVGGQLIDRLEVEAKGIFDSLCLNVHVRNPARSLYLRKGFAEVGQGRGDLGIAMQKILTK